MVLTGRGGLFHYCSCRDSPGCHSLSPHILSFGGPGLAWAGPPHAEGGDGSEPIWEVGASRRLGSGIGDYSGIC